MILVDTSVWIDHFRVGDKGLIEILNGNEVSIHPFVIGELACGNLQNRSEVLALLNDLPKIPVASDEEVLFFIERHKLMGRGIGYIDAHLLAASVLAELTRIWSCDKRLNQIAKSLNLAH
jgi:hypothetical protein